MLENVCGVLGVFVDPSAEEFQVREQELTCPAVLPDVEGRSQPQPLGPPPQQLSASHAISSSEGTSRLPSIQSLAPHQAGDPSPVQLIRQDIYDDAASQQNTPQVGEVTNQPEYTRSPGEALMEDGIPRLAADNAGIQNDQQSHTKNNPGTHLPKCVIVLFFIPRDVKYL